MGASVATVPGILGFRPMTESDLSVTYAWLDTPQVRQWYYKQGRARDAWDAEHLSRIEGRSPIRPFIMTMDGRPFGYLQAFFIAQWPSYAARVPDAPSQSAAVDLYIGRPDCLHRGLGSKMLDLFVRDYVFAQMNASVCLIGPEPQNRAAVRAYQKAGFAFWKIAYDPDYREFEYWMRRYPIAGQLPRPLAA